MLLTAVEFGLFTKLGAKRVSGAELGRELGLHPRGISDFFDALVAAGSVVTRDVAPNEVVAGVPARTIRFLGPTAAAGPRPAEP